jgi:hypothetical protein
MYHILYMIDKIIIILRINYIIIIPINNNALINNLWETQRPYLALQNFHGHAKEFVRNL